jgi:hypothetical protein
MYFEVYALLKIITANTRIYVITYISYISAAAD